MLNSVHLFIVRMLFCYKFVTKCEITLFSRIISSISKTLSLCDALSQNGIQHRVIHIKLLRSFPKSIVTRISTTIFHLLSSLLSSYVPPLFNLFFDTADTESGCSEISNFSCVLESETKGI